MKKLIIIGIILLFLGSCVPSIVSQPFPGKRIITVDDEPGDGDYTSIKEAVNSSNPGDTIEVYSGTYPEDGILLAKDNVSLLGISHELGEGNDSGRPFIKGNGRDSVIRIEATNQIFVSNLTIENPGIEARNFTCGILIEHHPGYKQDNITISDCTITFSEHTGIYVMYTRKNLQIIRNNISHCLLDGISITAYDPSICSFFIEGNLITDCGDSGIYFMGGQYQNVSGNKISRCSVGIDFAAENTSLYGNDIENCPRAIRYGGVGNIFSRNNFRNYGIIGFFFFKEPYHLGRNKWNGNYWDHWIGVGPKAILGFIVLYWGDEYHPHILFIPSVEFDRHPAKEPYDDSRLH